MSTPWQFALALPADYRLGDVLAFHRRDTQGVAEQVEAQRLRKGVLLAGVPVLLDVALPATADLRPGADAIATTGPRERMACCTVLADGRLTAATRARVEHAARDAVHNILGLRIDPAQFSAFVADDALFGPLTRAQPGLRIVQSATVFEALTWAVIGQQINLSFAIALRRTFIEQAGCRHSSGLWCYPDAGAAARLDIEALLSRKFSRAKAETLLRLAQRVADGTLRLEVAPDNSIEQISAALLAIKGIGPWTVNYGLLRGYGYPDCSLHGDVAIRAALQALLGEDTRPDMARTQALLAHYAPHRTMAAAHLWASLQPRAET